MKLTFTKMHGLGNDFVVFDFTRQPYPLTAAQAAHIADRRFGVGCDQILIVESSDRDGIDFKYRILNADGSEVGQCGNGARCFAKFVRDRGLTDKQKISVETSGGDMFLEITDQSKLVTVNIGVPKFAPESIPLAVAKQQQLYSLETRGQTVEFAALSIGNPHAVIMVDDVDNGMLESLGPTLESHKIFPQRANIGFMQVQDRSNIRLRVFERGVGETSACGSGACAAVASGIAAGLLDSTVTAHLNGGDLSISWQGIDQAIMMTGPANTVYTGEIELA